MSSGTAPVAVAIVGCGRLTELGYLPALARVPRLRLVAVADPDPIRRQRAAGIAAARGRPVPAFAGITSMLERVRPDAVVLASPAATHEADACEATAAGAAVLVEKPPAPDVVGAAALAALTPPPWIAFNRRFDPGVRALRARLPDDRDLDVRLGIHYRRMSWRAHVVRDDALEDLGPHLVDWVRWLTGRAIVAVTAREVSAERCVVDLTLDHGRATIRAATDRLHREWIDARAPDGRRVAHWSRGGAVEAALGRVRRGDHPLVTTLAAQLEALVEAVGGHPAPDLATAADGIAIMQVLAAARESAATASAVTVAPLAAIPPVPSADVPEVH